MSTDCEHLEQALLAKDRDSATLPTGDIDDTTAQRLVSELVDEHVVAPVPEGRILVHDPSGVAFDSITQLAVFHGGWTAGRDADGESE